MRSGMTIDKSEGMLVERRLDSGDGLSGGLRLGHDVLYLYVSQKYQNT